MTTSKPGRFARQGYIDSPELDYTSGLKFIEENWGLEPLAVRDARANNITKAFDFSKPPRSAKFLPFEREIEAPEPQPRVSVIYWTYGSALLLASGIIVLARHLDRLKSAE